MKDIYQLRHYSRIKKFISFKKIKTKEDYILWLNLSKKYQIVGIDKFLTKWRKSENSLSSSTIQKIIYELENIKRNTTLLQTNSLSLFLDFSAA